MKFREVRDSGTVWHIPEIRYGISKFPKLQELLGEANSVFYGAETSKEEDARNRLRNMAIACWWLENYAPMFPLIVLSLDEMIKNEVDSMIQSGMSMEMADQWEAAIRDSYARAN